MEKKQIESRQPEKKVSEKKPVEKKMTEKIGSEKKASEKKVFVKEPTEKKPSDKKGSEKKRAEAKIEKNQDQKKRKKKRLSKKKRALRRKRIRWACIAAAVLIAVLLTVFHLTSVVIDGRIYALSTQTIDLRGSSLTSTRGLARLTGLQEALLSDNDLTDVSALGRLADCEYIDLTGNPVSTESFTQLREALPDCLILCEAEDHMTTEMVLGGHPLPDVGALMRVFESHKALQMVDLRGTELTQEEAAMMCEYFPHINFIYSAGMTADTLMLNLDKAEEATNALQRVSDAAHVTVTGCVFTPDEYRSLQMQFPEMTIDCLLSLYGKTFPCTTEEIDLSTCVTDAALKANLSMFLNLSKLTLADIMPSEAADLKDSLGLDELNYSFNGTAITPELTELDLSGAQQVNAVELQLLLSALPQLNTVRLDALDESMVSVINAYQDRIDFICETEAFGQTFSGMSTRISLGDMVTDDDVEELMALIDRMPLLHTVEMYESELSKKSMDLLFDSYPDIFFGWTFEMCEGKYVVRTDITAFSTQIGLPMNYYTEEHLEQLRYCKNLQGLDLGHNNISNIDFLYNFPKLKVLILADNKFTDITPIASLTELEYLEIFMNNGIRDFTPLTQLPLEHLNICFCGDKENKVTADMFMHMTTLKRFWASRSYFDKEEGQRMKKALPDCTVSVTYGESTGDGWRRGEPYQTIVRMFDTRVYEPLP